MHCKGGACMPKKLISTVLAAATLFLAAAVIPCAQVAAAPETSVRVAAKAAIVLEARTGQVLYEQNADEPLGIASTTKIMTCLLALELADVDGLVTVTSESVGVEGSSLYLKAGEQMSLRELLYGLMLESGNDAAVAVAIHCSGSVEAFVEKMNEKAVELGCKNTCFKNPNGLTQTGHHSSARDMAVIMAAAMKNETFRQITATRSISFETRSFKNHNKLLWSCEGCVGGKTGYTKSSGRTLVTCAERAGLRLVCVTLNDGSDWEDHAALYEELFAKWTVLEAARPGTNVGSVPVITGESQEVAVTPEKGLDVLVEKGKTPLVTVELPRFVYAEVQEGARAGTLRVYDGERELGSVALVYAGTVEKDAEQKLGLWGRMKRLFGLG